MNNFTALPKYQIQDDNAQDLYLRVLSFANNFIRHSKLISLNIEQLKTMTPNAKELAQIMDSIADYLQVLAKDETSYENQQMALNVAQCSLTMSRISNAIRDDDQIKVTELMRELESQTNVPVPV